MVVMLLFAILKGYRDPNGSQYIVMLIQKSVQFDSLIRSTRLMRHMLDLKDCKLGLSLPLPESFRF